MELIRINKNQREDFKKVWQIAFDDEFSEDFCTSFFELEDLWDYAYGWVEGEKLVSTYLSLDVKVLIRNKEFSAKYIDGVATIPEYRRQGLIQNLMRQDAVDCIKKDIPIILLDPSKDSFYRKFGFEFALSKCRIRVDKEFCSKDDKGSNFIVKKDIIANSKELQAGYLELNKWFWENSNYSELKWPKCYEDIKFLREDINIAVAYSSSNTAIGYIIYQIEESSMVIEYFRYKNLDGFYALKNFIISDIKEVKDFVFNSVPEDFPFELMLQDVSRPEKRLVLCNWTSRMARVINLSELLNTLIEKAPQKQLSIFVKDDILKENEGYYVISTKGKVTKETEAKPDIITTINDIVPLLTGLKSAEELYRQERLKVMEDEALVKGARFIPEVIKELGDLLPKITTFSADEYLAP